jgi:hypothetical protein
LAEGAKFIGVGFLSIQIVLFAAVYNQFRVRTVGMRLKAFFGKGSAGWSFQISLKGQGF